MSDIQSPFQLDDRDTYQRWRDQKLSRHPHSIGDIIVEVGDPRQLTPSEHAAISDSLERTNMAIYVSADRGEDKEIPRRLAAQFGLQRLNNNYLADDDGITELRVNSEGDHPKYIPYTNRPIDWHTDGYYNRPDEQIHGLLLHCVEAAAEGGENGLLDHDIAYLLLRERSEDLIRAFMDPEVMTIPEGIDSEGNPRDKSIGPVFSINSDGSLHMRYTARKRNIEWKDSDLTRQATSALKEIFDSDTPYIFRGRLEAGMGLICRNVLHLRTGFDNGSNSRRLLYRARYFDAIPKQLS